MKNSQKILNIVLIISILIGDALFISIGGLISKSIASILFVLLGLVNLFYALKFGTSQKKFTILMCIGLFFAMLGDILLEIIFVVGAGFFAIGHVFYFISYCTLLPFKPKDLIFSTVIFIPSLLVLFFVPVFDFGGIFMQCVCIAYALVISLMVGKSISNYVQNKSILNLIILIGSCLFFFSDFMLVFSVFADISIIFSLLCLITYYPAECALAYSITKTQSA